MPKNSTVWPGRPDKNVTRLPRIRGWFFDELDWEPSPLTPTRKGVRWHEELDFGYDGERRRRERPPRA